MLHIAGETADRHQHQAETADSGRETVTEDLEDIKPAEVGGRLRGKQRSQTENPGAGEKNQAADKKRCLRVIALDEQVNHDRDCDRGDDETQHEKSSERISLSRSFVSPAPGPVKKRLTSER